MGLSFLFRPPRVLTEPFSASPHLPLPRFRAVFLLSLVLKQIAMQCLDKVAARPGDTAGGGNGARGGGGGGGGGAAGLVPAVAGAPSTSSAASPPSPSSSSSSSSSADQRARLTYTCDRHLFNFLAEPGTAGLTFCAVSPESAGRALPFAFLERVASDFHSRNEGAYSPPQLASLPAHALDRAFGPRLALAADHVSRHPESASKVAAVQRQVDAVRDVMVENIERVLERGERLELLVDKTDGLRDQAARFRASGRALRQKMWWSVSFSSGRGGLFLPVGARRRREERKTPKTFTKKNSLVSLSNSKKKSKTSKQNMKMRLMVGALIASLLLVVFASVCFSGGNCLSSRKN